MKSRVLDLLKQVKPDHENFDGISLVSQGILDSFDIIALCEKLHSELGITIDGADVIPENFETVDCFVEMLIKNGGKE